MLLLLPFSSPLLIHNGVPVFLSSYFEYNHSANINFCACSFSISSKILLSMMSNIRYVFLVDF